MCQRISLCSPRVLSLRFPVEKAMTLVEKAGWMKENLPIATKKHWETLSGHMTYAAQVSQELKFRKKMLGPVLKIWNMPQRREQHADQLRLALAHWTKLEKLIIWEPTKYPPAKC